MIEEGGECCLPAAIEEEQGYDCVPDFWYHNTSDSDSSSSSISTPNGEMFVFQHPIAIPSYIPTPSTTTLPQDSAVRESAMAVNCIANMYNLALAFHLRGTTSQGSSSSSTSTANNDDLMKACSLYELSHQMLQTTDFVDCLPTFVMAISNNMGIIHYLRGEHEKARGFFQHLLSTQMFVISQSSVTQHNSDDTDVVEEEVNDFDDMDHNDFDTLFDDDSYSVSADQQEGTFNGHDSIGSLNSFIMEDELSLMTTAAATANTATTSPTATSTMMMDGFWNNTLQLVLANGSAPAA